MRRGLLNGSGGRYRRLTRAMSNIVMTARSRCAGQVDMGWPTGAELDRTADTAVVARWSCSWEAQRMSAALVGVLRVFRADALVTRRRGQPTQVMGTPMAVHSTMVEDRRQDPTHL